MGNDSDPIDRSSSRGLARELVERIADLIRDGKMVRGDRLPTENVLAENYGVSRTVVREALSQLQAAGLVETYQGRGSFVLAKPGPGHFTIDAGDLRTHEDILEILEFRMGIEVETAGLAASRRTPKQLENIRAELEKFKVSGSRPSGAVDADFRFHLSIAVASHNRYYQDLLTSLGPTMITMPRTRLSNRDEDEMSNHFSLVVTEHSNIFQAIERQDPEAARAALRVHLSNSRARLSGHLH